MIKQVMLHLIKMEKLSVIDLQTHRHNLRAFEDIFDRRLSSDGQITWISSIFK